MAGRTEYQILFLFLSIQRYKVMSIVPTTKDQLSYLIRLDGSDSELDFWRGPSVLNAPVDVMVDPANHELLENKLRSRGMNPTVLVHDVKRFSA